MPVTSFTTPSSVNRQMFIELKDGTKLPTLRPTSETPIERARRFYTENGRDFDKDAKWYAEHGIIISDYDVFGMASVVDYKGEPSWFIGFSVGKVADLIRRIPPLKWVLFYRKPSAPLHARKYARLRHLAEIKSGAQL